MRRFVLISFCFSLLVVALVVFAPHVIVLLSFFIFPLFFILPTPTVALYALPLIPWAFSRTSNPVNKSFYSGLAVIALIAIAMPLAARWVTWSSSEQFTRDDIPIAASTSAPTPFDHVELVRPTPNRTGPETRYAAACGPLCQVILLENMAGKVTVSNTKKVSPRRSRRRRRANKDGAVSQIIIATKYRLTYTIVQRNNCPDLYPKITPLPALTRLRAQGYCIILIGQGLAGPHYKFDETELYEVSRKDADHSLIGGRSAVRFEISQRGADGYKTILRKTRFKSSPIALPLLLLPGVEFNLTGRNGIFFARVRKEKNPYVFETEVLHWLQAMKGGHWPAAGSHPQPSIRHEKVRDRLANRQNHTPRQLLLELLNQRGARSYGTGAAQIIRKWSLEVSRERELVAADLDIAKRVLQDRRFQDLSVLPSTLWRHAAKLTDVLPVILDRLEDDQVTSSGHDLSALSYLVAKMPIKGLVPHATRIIAIAPKGKLWHRQGLFMIVGQLDQNVEALFYAYLRSKGGRTPTSILRGICRSNRSAIGERLLQALATEFRQIPSKWKEKHRSWWKTFAKALVRHDRSRVVRSALSETSSDQRVMDLGAYFDVKNCQ